MALYLTTISFFNSINSKRKHTSNIHNQIAQMVGAVEYTDCTSAGGYPPSPMRLPVSCGWRPVMLKDRILVVEQSFIWQLKRSRDLQHSTLTLTGLEPVCRGPIRSISWSCQPSFRFLQKSELEANGCRVNHTEERPILLSVPGWVVFLGMKT